MYLFCTKLKAYVGESICTEQTGRNQCTVLEAALLGACPHRAMSPLYSTADSNGVCVVNDCTEQTCMH